MDARRDSLDGLRGLAAVAVVVYHSILGLAPNDRFNNLLLTPIYSIASSYDQVTRLVLAVFNGRSAVVLFFVLSGAVLAASLHREKDFNTLTALQFSLRRLVRIYVPLVACLLLYFIVANGLHYTLPTVFAKSFGWSALAENAALTRIPMHGATWTLQIEVLAIPVMLAAHAAWRTHGFLGLATLSAFGTLAYEGLPFSSAAFYTSIVCFMLGATAVTAEVGPLVRALPKHAWLVFLALAFALPHFVPASSVAASLCRIALCTAAIACLFHAPQAGGVLMSRPVVALGRISFSLYLLNVVAMNVFIPIILALAGGRTAHHYLEFGLLLAALTLIVSIPASVLSERYVERSSVHLGRRLASTLAFSQVAIRRKLTRNDATAIVAS